MKKAIPICLAFSYVALAFSDAAWLEIVVSLIVFAFLILTVPSLKGRAAKLISVLAVLTALLLINQENWLDTLVDGALMNLTIVAIFVLTPVLGIPFRTGGYTNALRSLLYKRRNSVPFFYTSTYFLTYILGAVINVGAISINHYLSGASNVQSNRLTANALSRGFGGALGWSPYFAAMALVVSQLAIEWASIAVYAVGFSLLCFLVGFLIEWPTMKKETNRLQSAGERSAQTPVSGRTWLTVSELAILLSATTCIVLLIERFSPFNMIIAIAFTAVFFPLLWCLAKGTFSLYKKEVSKHVHSTLPNLHTEIALFLLAGIFSSAFVSSKWSDLFVQLFSQWFGHSPALMTILLSIIIVGAGLAGLHPVVIVTILLTSIDPARLDFSLPYFAIAVLGSWSISNVLSPATAVNNLIAHSLNEKLVNIAWRWNWVYGSVMIVLLPIYLYFTGL